MNSLSAIAVCCSSTPIRSTSRSTAFAFRATSSCHVRVRDERARSALRDRTRERPVSTSNASIHPAEIDGSSKANALSMRTMKTSCVEFSWPSSVRTGSRR